MDRTHLPAFEARDSIELAHDVHDQHQPSPPQKRLHAPDGAPNILVVLVDDMGFGASSAFGGPCPMPVAEQLADNGLRYGRFHTTALCSPTRAALMTGRNHHSVGMAVVTEMATDHPGYDAMRGPDAGTLAQALNLNGYATGAFGKWHQTPPWEQTAAGPFDRWPTNEGFDKFYGILAAESSQFTPTLVDGTTFVDPPASEADGYHLSEDLADQVQHWIRQVRSFDKDKPWFTYLAFGACHAPFHLPKDWRGRHEGEFAEGWDRLRETILARQKKIGVVPEETELAPWRGGVPHWDELDDTQRAVAERLMETYASFAEHTDAQVGCVIDHLRETGELDNTLIFYILGDNGASAEGGLDGTLNELVGINGIPESAGRILDQLDEIGGPTTYPHYNVGWALALDTPYQWAKQVASHYGGTRNGLIVHWPEGIKASGEIRQQWHHVIDVAPTILEAAGLPVPESINGVPQREIEGTSMLYSFDEETAADRHTTQYFEMFGNRGIYHEGWTASAQHRIPWQLSEPAPHSIAEDLWELYDTTTDWSQAHDLAAEQPEKLEELKALFESEARKYNVLPIDDRGSLRLANAAPRLGSKRTATFTPRDGRLRENVVPNVKNASFTVAADVEVGSGGAEGVLVAQGGRFAGWSFYLDKGRPAYVHNLAGVELYTVTAGDAVEPGRHEVAVEFTYDGGGLGKGGDVRLLVDGTEVSAGRVDRTVPFIYSIDETFNVGVDRGAPVTDAYPEGYANAFAGGTLHTVTVTVADDAVEPDAEQAKESVLGYH